MKVKKEEGRKGFSNKEGRGEKRRGEERPDVDERRGEGNAVEN